MNKSIRRNVRRCKLGHSLVCKKTLLDARKKLKDSLDDARKELKNLQKNPVPIGSFMFNRQINQSQKLYWRR